MSMHTILGSGGSVGDALAESLRAHTDSIRLVSRTPKKINPTDALFPCDLMDAAQLDKAVAGSEVAYLTVGYPYSSRIWQEMWPTTMRNTLEACEKHDCKLVFLDNVYMYAPSAIPHMTESAPFGPVSKKGRTREQVTNMLLEAMETGKVTASIARAADFYGPGIHNSILLATVLDPLKGGKTANWLGKATFKHSYTYTPDAGKAMAILGNSPDSFNQTWHLPTADNPPTGQEWVERIASALGAKPKYREVGKGMLKLLGLFIKEMGETPEMLYQYTQDYVFDSSKWNTHFDFRPTTYEAGIEAIT